MLLFLSVIYFNLSAPLAIYCFYRAMLTKKWSLRKILLISSTLSILLGNAIIFMFLNQHHN